jgi:hypothetical protein
MIAKVVPCGSLRSGRGFADVTSVKKKSIGVARIKSYRLFREGRPTFCKDKNVVDSSERQRHSMLRCMRQYKWHTILAEEAQRVMSKMLLNYKLF